MGWRLAEEVQECAPDALTHREMYVLVVLAMAARDATRTCPEGATERPDIIARMRCSKRQRYAVLESLTAKGALRVVRSGRAAGRTPVYAIARFAAVDNRDLSAGKQHSPSAVSAHSDGDLSAGIQHSPSAVSAHSGAGRPISLPSVIPVTLSLAQLTAARLPEATAAQRERFVWYVKTQLRPRDVLTYLRSWTPEDWARHWDELQARAHAIAAPRPEWCGSCDEDSRQIELPNGTAARCRACHPAYLQPERITL